MVISGRGKGGGGVLQNGMGGKCSFTPTKKGVGGGGTEQVLAMLSGGTTGFEVALTMDLEVVATLIFFFFFFFFGGGGDP